MKRIIVPIEKRFFDKVEKTEKCWLWKGAIVNGYGKINTCNGAYNQIRAHRLSYEIHVGKIPKGMDVCHKCDIRNCVNPSHLFLGTRSDNMRDCQRKGRMHIPNPKFGENHHGSKFTWHQIKKIRKEFSGKRGEIITIANFYKVNRITIYRILRNKNWLENIKDK